MEQRKDVDFYSKPNKFSPNFAGDRRQGRVIDEPLCRCLKSCEDLCMQTVQPWRCSVFCEEEDNRSVGDNLLNFSSCQCKLVSDLRVNWNLPSCSSWMVQYLVQGLSHFFYFLFFLEITCPSLWLDWYRKMIMWCESQRIPFKCSHSNILVFSNYSVCVD